MPHLPQIGSSATRTVKNRTPQNSLAQTVSFAVFCFRVTLSCCWRFSGFRRLLRRHRSLFAQARGFAVPAAQTVQLRAAHVRMSRHFDFFHARRMCHERALDADAVGRDAARHQPRRACRPRQRPRARQLRRQPWRKPREACKRPSKT